MLPGAHAPWAAHWAASVVEKREISSKKYVQLCIERYSGRACTADRGFTACHQQRRVARVIRVILNALIQSVLVQL